MSLALSSPRGLLSADGPRGTTAIAAIPEDAWTPIRYPQAIWDDQLGCWASDAEIAQTDLLVLNASGSASLSVRVIA